MTQEERDQTKEELLAQMVPCSICHQMPSLYREGTSAMALCASACRDPQVIAGKGESIVEKWNGIQIPLLMGADHKESSTKKNFFGPSVEIFREGASRVHKLFSHQESLQSVLSKAEKLDDGLREAFAHHATWAMDWYGAGFPVVKFSPKWGAAAISTSISEEIADKLEMPWPAFLVEIPRREDILFMSHHGEKYPVGFIALGPNLNIPDELYVILFNRDSSALVGDKWTLRSRESDSELAFNENSTSLDLATRLLHSILCTLNENKHVSRQSYPPKPGSKNERTGKPIPYYVITEPVKIDLTEHVRQYQIGHGKGKKLELQLVVRGHRRLQHFGSGRSQSKIIWIEPYIKGPEYAPMAVRSHILQRSKEER